MYVMGCSWGNEWDGDDWSNTYYGDDTGYFRSLAMLCDAAPTIVHNRFDPIADSPSESFEVPISEFVRELTQKTRMRNKMRHKKSN